MASTDKTFVSPPLRCGYVNVFEPKLNQFNGNEEYSVQLIIHKKRDKEFLAKLRAAVTEIANKTFDGKVPRGAHNPIVDAAEWHEEKGRPLPEYLQDCVTVNVKSQKSPGIVDREKQEVIDPREFQSGDYARVHFNIFGYTKGAGGVSASLQNLQVIRKGEPLGSYTRPENVFDEWEDEEEQEDWAA